MPKNLLTELKEKIIECKKLLNEYQKGEEIDNDSYKFLALCIQEAHFAVRDLDYKKIKASLEALRSFE